MYKTFDTQTLVMFNKNVSICIYYYIFDTPSYCTRAKPYLSFNMMLLVQYYFVFQLQPDSSLPKTHT